MLTKQPDFIVNVYIWYCSHSKEFSYATISGVMAFLRSCWFNTDSIRQRIFDIFICTFFAYNIEPAINIIFQVVRRDYPNFISLSVDENGSLVHLMAIMIGFIGTGSIANFINKKMGL